MASLPPSYLHVDTCNEAYLGTCSTTERATSINSIKWFVCYYTIKSMNLFIVNYSLTFTTIYTLKKDFLAFLCGVIGGVKRGSNSTTSGLADGAINRLLIDQKTNSHLL